MCGGGGSMPAPDPMAEAQANAWLEREKQKFAEQERQREEAMRAQVFEQNRNARDSAFTNVKSRASDMFNKRLSKYDPTIIESYNSSYGLDPNTLLDDRLNQLLEANQPSDTARNQGFFYNVDYNDIINDTYENYTGNWRDSANKTLSTTFKPNVEREIFSDQFDDPFIEEILQNQYTDASANLLNAFNRGQLNQTGYDYALSGLTSEKDAARAKLQQLGGDVLSGYRSDVTGLRDKAYQERDSLDFGQNLTDYGSMLDNLVNERKGRVRGDISNALGNEKLFNTSSLVNKAGGYQGATNLNFSGAQSVNPLVGQAQNVQKPIDDQQDEEETNVGKF